jgi:hypothetical protein
MRSHEGEAVTLTNSVTGVDGTRRSETHAFTFERAFGAQASQEDLYAELGPLVISALDGCVCSDGRRPACVRVAARTLSRPVRACIGGSSGWTMGPDSSFLLAFMSFCLHCFHFAPPGHLSHSLDSRLRWWQLQRVRLRLRPDRLGQDLHNAGSAGGPRARSPGRRVSRHDPAHGCAPLQRGGGAWAQRRAGPGLVVPLLRLGRPDLQRGGAAAALPARLRACTSYESMRMH